MNVDLDPPRQGPDARLAPVQTVGSVALAEIAKLFGDGGLRTWWIVAAGLGLVGGIGTVALANISAAQEVLALSVSATVSTGPLIALTVVSLATAGYVPREISDGTVITAKCLVPRTSVLFLGRLLGWFAAASGVMALTAMVPLPLALVQPAVLRSRALETGVALLLAILVPALTVVLVHVGATILRKGAYNVAIALTVLVILPLLLTFGQVMLTGAPAAAARAVGTVLVGPLIAQAMTVPSDGPGTWADTVRSLLGVLGWLVATTAIAFRRFATPGYGA